MTAMHVNLADHAKPLGTESMDDLAKANHDLEKQRAVPDDQSGLAPVDRGFAAWSTLAASCIMGLFVFGFPNSSGVLLAALLEDKVYSSQRGAQSMLPLIGTLNTGLLYCTGVVIHPTIRFYPCLRKVYTWLGTIICFLSLLAASFTTNLTMMIALEGVCFGIGASLVYCPLIWYMSEWFVERRGLANGILFAADNAGGMLFPIIMPILISRFGIAVTIRIYAIALAACMLPAAYFMKSRLPLKVVPVPQPSSQTKTSRAWLRDRRFWFFIGMNTLQGLAHFVPLTWLPTFATGLGLSEDKASLVLTLANGAMTLSGFGVGWLSDRCSVWVLALSSLVLSALATCVLWGITAVSLAGVLACGAVYGLTAGCWSSLWSAFVRPIAADDPALATTIFSFLFLTRGIGNLASTPITTALQRVPVTVAQTDGAVTFGFMLGDGQFMPVIIYAGACFMAAALLTTVGWALERRSGNAKQIGDA